MGLAQSVCPHCVGCEARARLRPRNTVREYVVRLNVYEIKSLPVYSGFAAALGSGLYHSGIEISQVLPNGDVIEGFEYCFGANPEGCTENAGKTGVWVCKPRRAKMGVKTEDEQLSWLTTLEMGTTKMSKASMSVLLDNMKHDWPAEGYHLIQRNCNHFSDSLAHALVGRGLPPWVNEIATATNRMSTRLGISLQSSKQSGHPRERRRRQAP